MPAAPGRRRLPGTHGGDMADQQRGPLFHRANLRRLAESTAALPTLGDLERRCTPGLLEFARRHFAAVQRTGLKFLLVALPTYLVAYAYLVFTIVQGRNQIMGAAAMILFVCLYFVGLRHVRLKQRRLVVGRIVLEGARAIERLERHPESWQEPDEKRALLSDLESIARLWESFPRTTGPGDPHTSAEVEQWAQRVAAHIRSLKLWVIWPQDLSYTDLLHELGSATGAVLEGRWSDVPQSTAPDPAPRPTRLLRAGLVALGLALLTVAGLAAVYSTQLGPAVTGLAPLVGIAGLTALGQAGLSLQSIVDSKKALDALRGTAK